MIARTSRTDYLSVGQACREFGLSAPTLRSILDQNDNLCFRSIGGHRRVSRRALSDHLGVTTPNGTNGNSVVPLALVCRVSGSNQARKSSPTAECSSLEHQQKRVEEFAREKFGDEALNNATKYYRVGGGLNHEHPILVQLISDILNGKFRNGYIICQDSIRLMRFGNGIFDQICSFGNCQILYVMEVDRSEAEVDLSESILSILCHFTAKASGMRAKKILEITVSENDLVRIYKQYKQGCSYADLAKYCAQQGIVGTVGTDSKPIPLSPAKLHQILSRNQKVLEELVPDVGSHINEFVNDQLVTMVGHIEKQVDIFQRYIEWCGSKGYSPLSAKKMGAAIKAAGVETGRAMGGMKVFRGVALR